MCGFSARSFARDGPVPRVRSILIVIGIAVVCAATCIGYSLWHTVRHIPEAYAAWDTGTLLIEYMESHDNRWPTSWDDLLSVLEGPRGEQIILRGARAGDMQYARSLSRMVAVDWTFDPADIGTRSPVTRPDGSRFPVVWHGCDPNAMIREYLQRSPSSPGAERPTSRQPEGASLPIPGNAG